MYYIFNLHKSLQISPYKTDESYTEIEFYTSYDNLLDQYLREREIERERGGGENRWCSKLTSSAGKMEEEEDEIECYRC